MEMENVTRDDYVRYDRVWQRVAPDLDPYPEVRCAAVQPKPGRRAESCSMERSAADVEALAGFIGEALESRRAYIRYGGCAPSAQGRRVLRQMAAEEGGHARRLMGLYYMATGQCYGVKEGPLPGPVPPWQELLRSLYREESCRAYAFTHAAGETEDVLLRQTLEQFAADAYRHARQLLQLLEGNLLA